MAKVDQIVAVLETRLRGGDYAFRPVPTEASLAAEMGVSRMTARKAILLLIDRGRLVRSANGRVAVNDGPSVVARHAVAARVAFAAPAFGSPEIDRWRAAAERATAAGGRPLRVVHFHHWDDPVLRDAADGFDGLFLVPPAEPVPAAVGEMLRSRRARVVALDGDLTGLGLRSVDLIPPTSVRRLIDHLTRLGHRAIDCFNTQPVDAVIEQRVAQWSQWRATHGSAGELVNVPDVSYGDPRRQAYETMARRLGGGPPASTAVLCVTLPAAVGAMRAMHERGLRVGRDVSVCAANDEGMAAYLCPSLTATQMPDPAPYLATCLAWMAGDAPAGPMLTRPAEVPLFVGESTGPAPRPRGG